MPEHFGEQMQRMSAWGSLRQQTADKQE